MKTKNEKKSDKFFGVVLPKISVSRGGSTFDPQGDFWVLREGVSKISVNFAAYPPLDVVFKSSLKATMLWYAQNRSTSHVKNLNERLLAFLNFKAGLGAGSIFEVSHLDVLNYRASLDIDRQWYMGTVAGFVRRWSDMGLPGITPEACSLIGELKLKGNRKGVATLTMDPVSGPLTQIELNSLQVSLNQAFSRGAISLSEFVLCWLVMALGMRPIQYAALKVRDFFVAQEGQSIQTYVLRMPRAKQRNTGPREEFSERVLSPELGRIVLRYVECVKRDFERLSPDVMDAPLFPGGRSDDSVLGYEYHCSSRVLANRIKAAFSGLKANSERNGEPINITSRRFRQTIGTRAAEEGHGALVIAELLDHSDIQNVGIYIAATPAIVDRIDRAMAMQMAPLAQAFAGKLATRPLRMDSSDHSRHIRAPGMTGDMAPMASCGSHTFCGFLKPIACYTCANFEPWLDGPHDRVLQHLLDERDRLMQSGDARIATINDRTILAVAEVIKLCSLASKD